MSKTNYEENNRKSNTTGQYEVTIQNKKKKIKKKLNTFKLFPERKKNEVCDSKGKNVKS